MHSTRQYQNTHSHTRLKFPQRRDQHFSSRLDYQRSTPSSAELGLSTNKPPDNLFLISSLSTRHHFLSKLSRMYGRSRPSVRWRNPMLICSNQGWAPSAVVEDRARCVFVSRHSAVMIIKVVWGNELLWKCHKRTRKISSVGINRSPRPSRLSRYAEKSSHHFSCRGTETGRVQAAGTCSRSSHHQRTPWGSHGSSGQTRRSCSTSCRWHTRLRIWLVKIKPLTMGVNTHETCGRNLRKSSRSCRHRPAAGNHHRSCYRRKTCCSCGQCGRSHHTGNRLV